MNLFNGLVDFLGKRPDEEGLDPSNTDFEAPVMEQAPQEPVMMNDNPMSTQPEGAPVGLNYETLRQYTSPEAISALREQANAGAPVMANIMQWFPRLQGAANAMRSAHANKIAGAQADLANRMQMAAKMEELGIERDKFGLMQNADQRTQTEFDQDQAFRNNQDAAQALGGMIKAVRPAYSGGKIGQSIDNLAASGDTDKLMRILKGFGISEAQALGYVQEATKRRGQDIDLQTAKLSQDSKTGGIGPLTPGQEKVDKDFAKEYVDWNAAGGYSSTMADINKLRENVLEKLDPTDTSGDQIKGIAMKTPGIGQIIDPEKKAIMQNLESVTMKSLKKILGGQFSEREGQKLIESGFDAQLSDAENYKRVQNLINDLETRAREKERASKYYENWGTLKGYQGTANFSGKSNHGDKIKATDGKPKTVIQNGYTYTLNPETGEYE